MSKGAKIGIAVVVFLVVTVLLYSFSPVMRGAMNEHMYEVQKADDATRYETRKKVEDTCRAMIASYEADVLTWKQYNGSDNEERQGWADQAQMRANKTASTYNAYILKNSFVWEDNVPSDIRSKLPLVGDEE